MPEHTAACAHCGDTFTRTRLRGRPPIYCGTRCRKTASSDKAKADGRHEARLAAERAKRIPVKRTITCGECDSTFEGAGKAKYCGPECRKAVRLRSTREWAQRTDYHARHRAKPEVASRRQERERKQGRAYRQKAKVAATCIVCAAEWMADCKAKTRPVKYCSMKCRYIDTHGGPSTPVPARHPSRSTRVPEDHPSRKRPDLRPRFMVGRCAHCGDWFTADRLAFSSHADRSCSQRCARRLAKTRRRAAERGAYVAQVNRFEIFERDQWMCKLCSELILREAVAPHPLSPSIDHVVPLARGGTHEPGNVQAAHLLCNSVKSDLRWTA